MCGCSKVCVLGHKGKGVCLGYLAGCSTSRVLYAFGLGPAQPRDLKAWKLDSEFSILTFGVALVAEAPQKVE